MREEGAAGRGRGDGRGRCRFLKGSVVNPGDGAHAHPTQALLDTFTILDQVTNGLAVRMAVLFLVNGGQGPQEISA